MSRRLLNLCLVALLSVASTAAWALSEVNGVYQIGTADDLKEFAELVNGGKADARAVLTADIDKGMDGTMIGRDGLDYQGIFDGNGHTITINLFSEGSQGTALFRNVGVRALIKNLKVQGTITSDQKFASGIAVWSAGIIRGCYIDLTVNSSFAGDATHGGLVAVARRGTVLENNLVKFKILGATTQNCGGLIGWCDHPVNAANNLVITDGSTLDLTNNGSANIARNGGNVRSVNLENYNQDIYANRPNGASSNNYVTNQWGDNAATSVVSYDNLADGRICFQLNTDQSKINWVQRIGTDPFPVPAAFGSGQVYASAPTACDGKSEGDLTFSNSGTAQATEHRFDKYGICSECGCFNFQGLEFSPEDNAYLLKSAADIDLAEGWNRIGDGFKVDMKMANDIEYTAEKNHYIFNTSNWVDGNFNGDGHQLTIVMDIDDSNASFIPQFSGTFENVIMHGSITTAGQYAGSITSHTRNSSVMVRNFFSDIDINTTHAGDNTTGGFFGVVETKTQVENAIYAGNINGNPESTECLAGFSGWASGQTYYTNCAFLGTLNGAIGDSKTLSRNPGNITCTNVYYANEYGYEDEEKATLIENHDDIESGALAYALNGNEGGVERFYQKIGEDLIPMPIKKEGALVYASAPEYRCDGQPIGETVYTNSPSSATIPPHQYDEGFCSVCGTLQEDFMTPVDGWFEISNGAELLWWSHYASRHLDASAKLTDDIDMNGYSERWADVGTEGAPFYGNFDGQYHTISNLVVDKPNTNGVGLVAVMNSLPSAGFGGISDADARAAEGVYIKNVVLDETCSLLGRGYIGIVGMTAPWAGHVNISGLMMCGDVTANGGPNASGVFGCVMSSTCHVTINNSGMVGNVYGPKENGSFSGWLGSYAEVTNCYAVGSVEGIQDDDHYFARYGTATITNCYAKYGTQVPTVSDEDFVSGALAWRANGSQFRTGYWYQDIGVDNYPFPDPSHGTVIFAADQYFSVANEADLAEVATAIKEYEEEAVEETIATQSVLDEYKALLEALTESSSVLELADAVDAVNAKKSEVASNAAAYQAYITKCEEVKAYLESHDDFAGDLRASLEYYLSESDEPSDENPLGTYAYIVEEHTATADEIKAETERVTKWLADAIAADYVPGTDISSLIPNSDFSKQKENWTGGWSTGYSINKIQDETGKYVTGVEAWNVTGDQYQTVEGMKPGYYLVGINGAFRPSNNRYSTNYAAGIYANGVFNYFPTVIEDMVPIDEAEDGVNCNLTIKSAYDLAVYEDGFSTNDDNGSEIIGYAVHGETGMAIAAAVNRYQAYTIAKVGEDSKLTIGIKNPGTKYSNDWTGWGPLKVTYCGESAEDALNTVLENMGARAQTIMDYEYDQEVAAAGPNFPAALKAELEAAQGKISEATTDEAKYALAQEFSDIFQRIYEGKQAYVKLYNTAIGAETIATGNLSLVEKDEDGTWVEKLDADDQPLTIFSFEETEALYDASGELLYAYNEGTYSTEEALNMEPLKTEVLADIVPEQDESGYYLLSTPKHLAAFRAVVNSLDNTVKAKMVADIDMTGIAMQPIGMANHIWTSGVFDGQGHSLSNLFISTDFISNDDPATLFYELKKATVKNLKLSGEYHGGQKYMGGVTRWMSEGSTVDNCDIAVALHSAIDGDGTHGGVVGIGGSTDEVISNCLVHCQFYSDEGVTTTCVGGVCGWANSAPQVKNTLIMNDYVSVSTDGSNTVSRNGSTLTNVFVKENFGDAAGTVVTPEQLASGEITYRLNGSQSENVAWYQTIGTDATPHLFGDDVVYFYGGQYINDKPNPQLNAFAYDLDARLGGDNVVVTFKLNAEAESAEVKFSNGVTKAVEGELKAGSYSVTVPASELGADPTTLNFEIAVKGKGSLDARKIGDSYKVWAPYGMAINNNPESKGFGQVLIAETWVQEYPAGYISTNKPGALYAFDPDFKLINAADGTPGFYGGLDIKNETPLAISGSYTFDLKDLRFTEDGRLFVGRASGTSNSSVWEINPDDLNEPWKPIFTGGELDEATGITYVGDDEQNRMAVGIAVEGKGEDLKLYVLGGQRSNGDYNTTDYNCAFYNLGTATEWTAAPSGYITALDGVYTIAPGYVGIHEDGQGGLWYIQYRSTPSAELPAIKHYDAEGNEDYSDISTATYSGRMAVTSDGKYLAIPKGSGKIVIYETNYVPMENGKIFLNPIFNIGTSETSITSLAFDYANNLYVASGGTETISRYVIPSWNDNLAVTPGNGIVKGLKGDVNGDGQITIADGVAVLNAMAGQTVPGNADVNGDGDVTIADFVAVLNLMAAQ